MSEARALVRDLLQPNPVIYWVDFLFHITVGWTAFVFTVDLPAGTSYLRVIIVWLLTLAGLYAFQQYFAVTF